MYLAFGLYEEPNRYALYCEPFAERVVLPRASRADALAAYAARYAARLEHYCRLAPYNWFNFYDFWSCPMTRTAPSVIAVGETPAHDRGRGGASRAARPASCSIPRPPSARASAARWRALDAAARPRRDHLRRDDRLRRLVRDGRSTPRWRSSCRRNLVRFHGCGTGRHLGDEEAAAVVAVRLATLARGHSAVRETLLERLCELLERRILPCIPEEGSVGASGDLTPLSYLAALVMGEREARVDGYGPPRRRGARPAGLAPLALRPKESLALMNGTSVMTALACLAFERARRLARTCLDAHRDGERRPARRGRRTSTRASSRRSRTRDRRCARAGSARTSSTTPRAAAPRGASRTATRSAARRT